jgi:nucleotide-binding universal stress UspA family protein
MYSTLMVILELGRDNSCLLKAVGGLAERFGAEVIGVASCEPLKVVGSSGNLPGGIVEMDDAEIRQQVRVAESQFRALLGQRARGITWRASITDWPSEFVIQQARNADLIIANEALDGNPLDRLRYVSTSDLVMQAGRPVLVLPPSIDSLPARHILVAWKDTREARRAVADALPLLKSAARVTVLEIASNDSLADAQTNVVDVAYWLGHHGVTAHGSAVASSGDDAKQLSAIVEHHAVDLIVAGAYGHSRFREWVFGGVTRDLLLHAKLPVLLSH